MAHVTIDEITPRVTYTVGGTPQTEFTIPSTWGFFELTDFKVYVGGVEITYDATPADATEFSVAGTSVDGGYQGGTVTLGAAVSSTTVGIVRNVPYERTTDFPYPSSTLNILALNTAIDRIAAWAQQFTAALARAIQQPAADATAIGAIPEKDDRASKFLAFDSDGDPIASDGGASVAVSTAMTALVQALSVAAARTVLGLGTAAVLDAGTDDGDVVAVQTGGKLPALDGSDLTGVAVEDQTARDIATTALIEATSTGGLRGPVVSWVASADNFSTKTGATFATDHYHNPGTVPEVAYTTPIGNMTGGGGLAAAFDNADTWATRDVDKTGWVGVDHGAGVTKTITKLTATTLSSTNYSENYSATVTATLYGSNTAPSTGTDGTALWTGPLTNTMNVTTTVDSGITATTAYRYHWLRLSHDSASTNAIAIDELELFETIPQPDMTLADAAETITAGADLVDVYVLETTVDASPTRRIRASIDGGSTWSAAGTLESTWSLGAQALYRYACDVSAQTGGSLTVEYNSLDDGKERSVYRLDAVPLYA